MIERDFVGGAIKTTTVSPISNTHVGFVELVSTEGFPSVTSSKKFVACLARGTANEEKVLVDFNNGSGISINTNGRGYDGTTARSHIAGTSVELVVDAVALQYIIDTANEMQILQWMDV